MILIHKSQKIVIQQTLAEWNSYQTVLRNRSHLIFKNKGEVWFFLFFYCENTFSVTNTHFTPDKKSFKWVPHNALIWHWKTPLGQVHLAARTWFSNATARGQKILQRRLRHVSFVDDVDTNQIPVKRNLPIVLFGRLHRGGISSGRHYCRRYEPSVQFLYWRSRYSNAYLYIVLIFFIYIYIYVYFRMIS